MPSKAMKSSTPRLSEQAKHLSIPDGVVSTGWSDVRRTCVEKLGLEFDPWQDQTGQLIMSKRADGSLACMVDGVGMSLPRQVGKTHLVAGLIFALCVNMPGLLVIWTAHHMATSTETFLAIQGFAQRVKIAPHVAKVYTGSGDEEVRFVNGSRILFGARERGFGRGIPGVDVLIFDEAQILSDRAMSNMLATMNTSSFGLQLYMGTPPKPEDQSETFKRMRREALAGTLSDGAWVEFGAADDAKSDDRTGWRRMNPSYPKRTPVQSLQRLRRKLTEADWRREGMGIWDADVSSDVLVPVSMWSASGVDACPEGGVRVLSVAFNFEGDSLALVSADRVGDSVHVELVDSACGDAVSGLGLLADWIAARWRKVAEVALCGAAGSATLRQLLLDRGVPSAVVRVVSTGEYTAACSMFLDGVREGARLSEGVGFDGVLPLTHAAISGQSGLDASVTGCVQRKRGTSGAWGWAASGEGVDETPVEAASVGFMVARTTKRKPYGDKARKSVIL